MVSLIYQDSKKVELIGAKSRLAVARGCGGNVDLGPELRVIKQKEEFVLQKWSIKVNHFWSLVFVST